MSMLMLIDFCVVMGPCLDNWIALRYSSGTEGAATALLQSENLHSTSVLVIKGAMLICALG